MNCADVNDQITDFLYDELPPEARRSFEAHLVGCPACAAELQGLGTTLGQTRAVLAAANEAVPARVQAAIEQMIAAAPRKDSEGVLRPVHQPLIPENAGGLWTWLRKPWFFPAFAAAAVISLFFLAREVLVPPQFEPTTAARPAAAPAPGVAAAPPASDERAVPPPAKAGAPADPAEAASAGAGQSAPAGSAGVRMESALALSGRGTAEGALAPAPAEPAAAAADHERRPSPPAPAATRPIRLAEKRAASPPAGVTVRAPAAVPVAAPYGRAREQRRDRQAGVVAESEDQDAVADGLGGLGASEARGGRAGVAAPAAAGAAAEPTADQADGVALAARLFAQGEMDAAAAAYRRLIARFPSHPDVATWKRRVQDATAQSAEAARAAAPTKPSANATTPAAPARRPPEGKPRATVPTLE